MQTQILKTREEKEDFLENDFLDRLIGIEQRISAKFGNLVRYTDTYCYKNLSQKNRKRYESYLKKKKKKKFAFAITVVLPLFLFLFLSHGITGYAIRNEIGDSGFQLSRLVLFLFLICIVVTIGISFFIRFRREKKFGGLFNPLERISKRKLYK